MVRAPLALAPALAAALAHAITIRVPGDEATIQAAIDAARDGDRVLVQPGTYHEALDFRGKRIVVSGRAPGDSAVVKATVIDASTADCGDSCSVVRFVSGEGPRSILAGFTLTGGSGIVVGGTMWTSSTVGGGIYCAGASPTIIGCLVRDNRALGEGPVGGWGGGAHCRQGAAPLFTECRLLRNSADEGGGGIHCRRSAPTLRRCNLNANTCPRGGGLYCESAAPRLERCIIAGNRTLGELRGWRTSAGAGLYCQSSAPHLDRCTISANVALEGGALYSDDSAPVVTNSILWDNASREIVVLSGEPILSYSDIEGGWPGEGNIDADPRFCDVVCGRLADLRLAVDSPCLGSGEDGGDMGVWGAGCDRPVEVGSGAVLEVPGTISTIGEALASACENDTVVIAPGSYLEHSLAVPELGIVVRGWDPADSAIVAATVIDGGGEQVLHFESAFPFRPSRLAGVTVTGGEPGIGCLFSSPTLLACMIRANSGRRDGGGIYCNRLSSPTLRGCTIRDNSTPLGGGGIWCERDSSPWIERCLISANYAGNGGGGVLCGSASAPTFERCVISDNSTNSCGGGLYCEGGGAPLLSGCSVHTNTARWDGGGLCCRESSPTLDGSIIRDNSAERSGGGIFVENHASPVLTGRTITGNSATEGGGLNCSLDCTPILDDCLIASNSASGTSSGVGGGIYCDRSSPVLTRCTVVANSAEHRGGGLYCDESSPLLTECGISRNAALDGWDSRGGGLYCSGFCDPALTDCSIVANSATKGGGLYCAFAWPTLTGCTIAGNSADANLSLGAGGGVYGDASRSIFTNCIIRDNWAGDEGGGLCLWNEAEPRLENCLISGNGCGREGGGITCGQYSSPRLSNCTFAQNTAGWRGGGLLCIRGNPELVNCILWHDAPEEIVALASTPLIRYSDVQGGWTGEGNIDTAPLFRTFGDHEYLLAPRSPCVDAGDPTIEDGISDWHPRWPRRFPNGPRSDMGATGGPGNRRLPRDRLGT